MQRGRILLHDTHFCFLYFPDDLSTTLLKLTGRISGLQVKHESDFQPTLSVCSAKRKGFRQGSARQADGDSTVELQESAATRRMLIKPGLLDAFKCDFLPIYL